MHRPVYTLTFLGMLLGGLGYVGSAATGPGGAPDAKEKTHVVPRERIHRNWQEADRPARSKDGGAVKEETYRMIRAAASHTGASNVFLVCANDFPAAIEATSGAYNTTFPPGGADWTIPRVKTGDLPRNSTKADVPPKPIKRPDVWLVAYLGSDSSDRWLVVRAERTGTRLRLIYTDRFRTPGVIAAGDSDPRLVWVPLGPIPGGKYTVDLFETVEKEVTLSRLVRVED